MKLREVVEVTGAEVLTGEEFLDREVDKGCGADLLSDVLSVVEDNFLLVTGMVTLQAVRVAEVMNAAAVLIVRGKRPQDPVITYAAEAGIPLLATPKGMFETCGLLYSHGIRPARFRHVSEYAG
ncbi:DRTGG domain-containing protein [Candidatus Bipolaricaulota sp. J31]